MNAERIAEIIKQHADEYYLMTDETIAKAAAAIMAEVQAETPITEAGLLALGFKPYASFENDDYLLFYPFIDRYYYLDYSRGGTIVLKFDLDFNDYIDGDLSNVKTIEDVRELIRLLGGE